MNFTFFWKIELKKYGISISQYYRKILCISHYKMTSQLQHHKFIPKKFTLADKHVKYLQKFKPNFGYNGLGEMVYYRTYSRCIDGKQETFHDTTMRVINGTFSIFASYGKNLETTRFNSDWQQKYARKFGEYLKQMKFTPPGRGFWSMGTDLVAMRGSAPLYNCAACDMKRVAHNMSWAMLMLMNGVGVGFTVHNWEGSVRKTRSGTEKYVIPDTREGWAESIRLLLRSYLRDDDTDEAIYPDVEFDYSLIRPEGAPIKLFGGKASGPEPLRKIHENIRKFIDAYAAGLTTRVRMLSDIANSIGVCVISGNVRRSAEILIHPPTDDKEGKDFENLKNYKMYPERAELGWASNNSIGIYSDEHYNSVISNIDNIVERIVSNGEPGIVNFMNVNTRGRMVDGVRLDFAIGVNPCGEIGLESGETCNLADVNLPNCESEEEIYQAMEFALFYCMNVSALPTHSEFTNKVIARNHRIGVSLSGVVEAMAKYGKTDLKRILNTGYSRLRIFAAELSGVLGFERPPIRITTIKPAGTVSLLAGVTPGAHHPPYQYAIRRVRVAKSSKIAQVLIDAGVKYEQDSYSEPTWCFEFYYKKDNVKASVDVDVEDQFKTVAFLQKYWADNMVSVTLGFHKEKDSKEKLAKLITKYLPKMKSFSMLPHNTDSYAQMPYEKITRKEYLKHMYGDLPETVVYKDSMSERNYIKHIVGDKFNDLTFANGEYSRFKFDWSKFTGSDGIDQKYCNGDKCLLVK